MKNITPFKVFFDGSCPLCIREINFYRKREGAEKIEWVDVAAATSEEVASGLSCDAAMKRFHVQLRDGSLMDGGKAFAALWRELPGFRFVGQLFKPAPMGWILDILYNAFLPIRPTVQRWFRR